MLIARAFRFVYLRKAIQVVNVHVDTESFMPICNTRDNPLETPPASMLSLWSLFGYFIALLSLLL